MSRKVATFTGTRRLVAALALAGTAFVAIPSVAQAQDEEARLRKIEAEVRALQRQVFPGGDGRYFTPEVTPQQNTTPSVTGTPASTAVTDILVRLDALEQQMAQLTAQGEENANSIAQLTSRLTALETSGSVPAAPLGGTVTPPSGSIGSQPVTPTPAPATTPTPTPGTSASTTAVAAGPSAARLAGVQAIAKPQTEDAADDEYSYGFRLWEAKYYPEAQQQLKLFVDKYPSHWRSTYGRNLLGRAYLDDGKPREAATFFLQNYQTDKEGARAPDSLLYLAESMIALKDTKRACIALAEFSDGYAALAAGRLKDQYEANRKKVTCN